MKSCKVTLMPGGATADFPEGTVLMDALADMGVMVPSPCGGRGFCGKCLVGTSGDLTPATGFEEKIIISNEGQRFACQASLAGNIEVTYKEAKRHEAQHYPTINPAARLGLAVDIGTTSVQISMSLANGESIPLDDFINPQRRYGHDVISRIAVAHDSVVAADLIRRIRKAVKTSMLSSLAAMGLPTDHVDKIVISGNTTMLYLFFGLDVSPLGEHPYRAERRDLTGFSPADVDMEEFTDATIEALPILSAFVGGDAVGGFSLCYSGEFRKSTFFIDLGTNGEIVLVSPRGEICAASCAMGPALEGMNMTWGMSADDGAITHVRFEGGVWVYDMIGAGEPVGISGTALIDITALLLEYGGMNNRGSLVEPEFNLPAPAQIVAGEGGRSVRLWGRLSLSQSDLRNLQLAKGASLAASRLLLEASGCGAGEIEQVIIAGALGRHLDLDNFRRLGFIPDFPNAEYMIAGNTSVEAAALAFSDGGFLKRAGEMRDQMTEVPLAGRDDFMRVFIKSLNFPAGT